jgi:hypothetical protein
MNNILENCVKVLNMLIWVFSILLMGSVVFGLYPDVKASVLGTGLSRTTHIIYQTFSKIAWSIGLSFLIYSCITDNGGKLIP